ncbi:MAG: hypothetical protein J6K95_07300 [Rikenellaceae bacterium]|nr:hypothetical protein [Rikenellaceae bacterium]
MNRIILIGNGFDLAHGLKTSYQNFLDDYWQKWYPQLCACNDNQISDELYLFKRKRTGLDENEQSFYPPMPHTDMSKTLEQIRDEEHIEIQSFNDISRLCKLFNEYHNKIRNSSCKIHHQFKSQLFAEIHNSYNNKWVDIENEYYQLLSKTYYGKYSQYETAEDLNADLNLIKKKLIEYLSRIQNEKITDELFNARINQILFEPFKLQDISMGGQDLFWKDILSYISKLCPEEIEVELNNNPQYLMFGNTEKEAAREIIKDKFNKGLLTNFLSPGRILFLNFNYTNTAEKLYAKSDENPCELIHIHGELNNRDNPIIFGYGDEMNEDYKKIVDLNNNGYLENIKSIRYLETDNYRNLLSFIDSAPYQIYIMGHSCGTSDRTLLNTLFEHENCVSIKPYYHQKEDGTDNYIDIIQNISRDFKDMTSMRDKVVNKKYCEPMVSR